jgi:hypothetical protein
MKRHLRLLILALALVGCTARHGTPHHKATANPIESQQLRQMLEDCLKNSSGWPVGLPSATIAITISSRSSSRRAGDDATFTGTIRIG